MSGASGSDSWWSKRAVPEGGITWRIGPLSLHVHRIDGEWLVAYDEDRSESAPADWSVETVPSPRTDLANLSRFATGGDDDTVRLRPRAADRSVVASPRAQLHVLAGEEARFYISAPVWVEVTAGDPPRPLCEMPTKRLTDTWFGSSTLEGEVAYALKTHARNRLKDVPPAAFRAVTPVVIRNHGLDLLALDRMNLPVPFLSIYRGDGGKLWTEAVTLVRGDDEEMATFEVRPGPPPEASGAELLGEPRQIAGANSLVRAFGRLLRPFQEQD